MRSRLALALLLVARAAAAAPALSHATPVPGAVPGAPSLVVTVKDDATHCGGHAVRVTAKRARPPLDADFVAAMTIDAPHGLDFDPAHKDKVAASTKRFNAFLVDATKKLQAARDRYMTISADAQASPQDHVIAAARVAQMQRHFADVLAFMEIPASVRTGQYAADTTKAFCDAMTDKAEALDQAADDAAERCGAMAADAQLGIGWWNDVCRTP